MPALTGRRAATAPLTGRTAGPLSTTVGVGGASLVSRSLGSGDPARAARAAGSAFVVSLSAAVVTAVLGLTSRVGPSYVISIGTLLVIKIPLVLTLGGFGPTGTWVALAAGDLLAAAACLVVLTLVLRRATTAGGVRRLDATRTGA